MSGTHLRHVVRLSREAREHSCVCREGLQWNDSDDSTGSRCCQAKAMEGDGQGMRVICKGAILVMNMESGTSKEAVRTRGKMVSKQRWSMD